MVKHGICCKSRKQDINKKTYCFELYNMISFLSMNVSKQLLTCLIKHNILKCLWCFHGFYKIKPKTESNAGIMSLIGDTRTQPVSWLKWLISLNVNILGNIWDHVSTQVNKIYNIVLVVFGYFNQKILHIVPLSICVPDMNDCTLHFEGGTRDTSADQKITQTWGELSNNPEHLSRNTWWSHSNHTKPPSNVLRTTQNIHITTQKTIALTGCEFCTCKHCLRRRWCRRSSPTVSHVWLIKHVLLY